MNPFFEEVLAVTLRDWRKKKALWKVLLMLIALGLAVFLIGYGFGNLVSESFYAGSYASFFSFGFLVYFILLIGITQGSDIIVDRGNFVKLMLVAPISKYSILFGKTLSTLVMSLRSFLFLGLLFLFLNNEFSLFKVLLIIIYCIFLILTGVALGLFVSTLSRDKKTAENLIGGVGFVVLFFSGVLFPVSAFPGVIQTFFKLNPLVYIVDLFRFLMIGAREFSLSTDIAVSLAFGLFVIFFGVYQFDRNLRR